MFLELILGLVALIIGYCFYVKNVKWRHFERKGILQMPTSFPFGNFNEMIFQNKHTNEVTQEMYNKADGHKYFGVYFLGMPTLTIRDPEIIRSILVKDFDHFVDRQLNLFDQASSSKTDKAWSRQLTSLMGDEWKDVRSTFSPIFTSGKMKAMMVFIRETSQNLTKEIHGHATDGKEVELKDVFGKFSMDTIASCAFGVDAQSFSSSGQSQFVKNASSVFTRSFSDMLKIVTIMIPGLSQMFKFSGASIFKPKETQFFIDVITTTLRDRISKGDSSRNDLIDMMVKAMKDEITEHEEDKNKEQFDLDSELQNHQKTKKKDLDELTIVATAMLMLIAGYDTTAQTLSYAGYELCKNPEIQKQLQEEVDLAYEEANGKTPDYGVIQNLPYLDMVIHETLRLHTPAGLIMRVCVKDFEVEGFKITKGMQVLVPAAAIHMDPKYYPNPEMFNPDNFSKESRANRSSYTFLGFGQGPRSCLAMRFALLEAKVALMSVVRHFNLKVCPNTPEKIELDPKSALAGCLGGLWVKPEIRQH